MLLVDDEGRDEGRDLPLEDLLEGGAVLLGKPLLRQAHEAADGVLHALGKEQVQPGQQLAGGLEHVGQLARGLLAGVLVLVLLHQGLVLQRAHAHPVKLVEVALEDGDKAQPLHQRVAPALGLFQHALVELHPAQLPVDPKLLFFHANISRS